MTTTAQLIDEDCMVLMDRAFLGKVICAFGEDGNGQHGRHDQAMWFQISEIDVALFVDNLEAPTYVSGNVALFLDGYTAAEHGHIMTDNNFEICMRTFLKNAHIDPAAVKWAPLSEQGDNFVVLDMDVPILVGWP